MKTIIRNLPDDLATSHQIIIDLVTENRSLKEKTTALEHQLALLRAKQFGASSEKLGSEDLGKAIDALEHQIEDEETSEAKPEEDTQEEAEPASDVAPSTDATTNNPSKPPKNKPRRKPLPAHLPRSNVVIPAPTECPSCQGTLFRTIGDDVSEILEYVPASFRVIRTIRPRCACMHCDQIVQGDAPGNTIDKGKAGPGLLAYLLVQKYCHHLPFYRQSQIYEREGIDLSRSTMASWAGQCAKLLAPLIEALRKEVFAANAIHTDDTPVPVLAPGAGKTKTGRLWVYLRDGRPHGDPSPRAVCYFYSADRKGERPQLHLQGFSGILHADAYPGYDKLYGETISEAACWAHTRRKFYEATVGNPHATIAHEVLKKMGKLYAIEEEIRGKPPETRKEARQQKTKPLVAALFAYFKSVHTKLPKKSPTAGAIAYATNHQAALERFLEDGTIEIDNNAAERAMRSIAIGRKNWLFAGSDQGGETAAALYSLIETAKLNQINPWHYLRHVLAHIQDHPANKIAELLPWNVTLP
jgi:transposase